MSNYDIKAIEALKSLNEIIKNDEGKYYYIFPHHSPDGDTLGSAIAFNELLRDLGHQGKIVLDDDIPKTLAFLPTDCIIKSEEAIQKADHIFILDCSNKDMFDEREFMIKESSVINIDHHKTNAYYGDENFVFPHISSTAEVVFLIYKAMEMKPNKIASMALYTGIVTDTGSFKYSNTTASTFSAASELMLNGIDLDMINVSLFQNIPLDEMQLKQHVLSQIDLYIENTVGVVVLQNDDCININEIEGVSTDGIVESVRNIEGISVAVFIKQISENSYKISMRSKYDIDVSRIAQVFNGGGHSKASGFKAEGSVKTISDKIVDLIKQQLNS